MQSPYTCRLCSMPSHISVLSFPSVKPPFDLIDSDINFRTEGAVNLAISALSAKFRRYLKYHLVLLKIKSFQRKTNKKHKAHLLTDDISNKLTSKEILEEHLTIKINDHTYVHSDRHFHYLLPASPHSQKRKEKKHTIVQKIHFSFQRKMTIFFICMREGYVDMLENRNNLSVVRLFIFAR